MKFYIFEVLPLFDLVSKQYMVKSFTTSQHVSIDGPMVTYFGRNRTKQYIHGKHVKFGYKHMVMTTSLGCCVHFCPYAGKDEGSNECMDVSFDLGGAVVASLTQILPKIKDSNL